MIAILAVYGQTAAFEFQSFYDDVEYVSRNPFVNRGLTRAGIEWAFTSFQVGNWHPLTALSHMLDCALFGLDAGYHHVTNVLLHALNSVLLLRLLLRTTGAPWRSAAVAALFALHPLHVESVAWISERKDVLSTLFGLLAIGTHVRYVSSPSFVRYAAVSLALALGLMAKPMLVTLPVVLLLLDYWPLGRFGGASSPGEFARTLRRLALEKAPLFALAAASSAVAFAAQWNAGAVPTLERLSLAQRFANALVSCVAYLGDAFWPAGLCAYYPRVDYSASRVAGALLVLALVSAVAFRTRKSRPWLFTGWLWYLVTLLPVIGLVQVGEQARADRYTYVPLVGIFWMVVWSAGELAAVRKRPQVAAAAAALVLAALSIASWKQVRTWRDSVTLFERALAVTEDNWFAHYDLAGALVLEGRLAEARPHFFEAVRIHPGYAHAQVGVGYVLEQDGRLDEALVHYREAVRLSPALVEARAKLGAALKRQGKLPEAAEQLAEVVRLRPEWAKAHDELGLVLLEQNEPARALQHFAEALRLEPGFAAAREHAESARKAAARRAP